MLDKNYWGQYLLDAWTCIKVYSCSAFMNLVKCCPKLLVEVYKDRHASSWQRKINMIKLVIIDVPYPLFVCLLQNNFGVLNNELQGDLNSYVENKMFDGYGILYQALVSKLLLKTIEWVISTASQELNMKLIILTAECYDVNG